MISRYSKNNNGTIINTFATNHDEETTVVKKFLENSYEYKQLQIIQRNLNPKDPDFNSLNRLINDIANSTSFANLVDSLSCFDFEKMNSQPVKSLSKIGLNTMLFFAKFVYQPANLIYYAMHLREEASCMMASLDHETKFSL